MPPEILAQIFLSCLPSKPISYHQPNTNIPPMNLCHICSYWRNVALGTPCLWNSLYHVCYESADVEDEDIFRYGIRPIDIEFLRWWSANIGPHPPILRLEISSSSLVEPSPHLSQRDAAESNHKFILDLLASAECLALGQRLCKIFAANTYKLISPNLRSLLITNDNELKGFYYSLADLLRNHWHPAQVYERLYIETLLINSSNFGSQLPWASLTHVCINLKTLISIWIHFLKNLPNLECGQFRLRLFDDGPPLFSGIILPRLRQFSISCESKFVNKNFQGLTFPTLTGFRLYTDTFPESGFNGLLRSTPVLTEFHCGVQKPSKIVSPRVGPLSTIIPDLKFLVIELSNSKFLDSIWRESFINSSWLDLRSGNNRIQTVLFYWDRMVDQRMLDIIEAHLAEIQINGVELCVDWNGKVATIFDDHLYKPKDFMHWDEEMGFYMEHTTNR